MHVPPCDQINYAHARIPRGIFYVRMRHTFPLFRLTPSGKGPCGEINHLESKDRR